MKSKIKYIALLFALTVASLIYVNQSSAQQYNFTYQVFYDQLSPYGQWVDYPNYGYVWMPDVGYDFEPYSSNGYWIMTDYGMTWVSNYNWGWAPFHYGRWDYDNYYGWFWIPDNEWGPAWVIWRRSSGYYGWAPMQPGISIMISFGNEYNSNYDHWIFVRDRDIDRRDVHRYHVNHRENRQIIRNSTVISNTYLDKSHHATYVSGPDRTDLRKNMGRNVRTASIHDNNSPGQNLRNEKLNIYRPHISRTNNNEEEVVPSRLAHLNEVKRYSDRNSQNQNKQISKPDHSRKNTQQNINQTNENRPGKEQTIKEYNQRNKQQQNNENLSKKKADNQKTLNQRNENNNQKLQNVNKNRQKKSINPSKKHRKAKQKSDIERLNKTNNEKETQSNNKKGKKRGK